MGSFKNHLEILKKNGTKKGITFGESRNRYDKVFQPSSSRHLLG